MRTRQSKALLVTFFEFRGANEYRPAPLTEEEMTMAAVKEAEYEASTSTSARKSHVSSGIKFPVSNEAIEALTNLPGGFITLVQLVSCPATTYKCRLTGHRRSIMKKRLLSSQMPAPPP
jgi:hypothetical protein